MTDDRRREQPDPDAVYVATTSWSSAVLNGMPWPVDDTTGVGIIVQGTRFRGDHPAVAVAEFRAFFERDALWDLEHGRTPRAPLADDRAKQFPSEAGYSGLTREMVLDAKRAHDAEGHTSMAINKRLLVSKATLIRARHALGLVPWPKNETGDTGSERVV
jgi:hypothetical protein